MEVHDDDSTAVVHRIQSFESSVIPMTMKTTMTTVSTMGYFEMWLKVQKHWSPHWNYHRRELHTACNVVAVVVVPNYDCHNRRVLLFRCKHCHKDRLTDIRLRSDSRLSCLSNSRDPRTGCALWYRSGQVRSDQVRSCVLYLLYFIWIFYPYLCRYMMIIHVELG